MVQKCDIICLSEIYLYSSVPRDDGDLVISGYNLIRSDHPYNTRREGVCLYYKIYLPLRFLNISYLIECLNFELKIGDKSCNFVVLCSSLSQSPDDCETLSDNFEITLEIIGDFNAKSWNWYSHDKASFKGSTIESITSQFGLYQLSNEPTHLLQNSSLCMDLIFTSQPKTVVELDVNPSLPPNCHHQIVFAKFNLKIYYLPSYLRDVWDTIKKQMPILSNEQLTISTKKKLFVTLILPKNFPFLTRRS